ncbi:sugar-binding domain-containing protein [Saliphagus sp. LR7]|uniref:sugar-binding domain-containing protein n=1 Tax=Saliphagus sp. LR7 TaxID=2282654 RepID=UPI000DF7581B|nr:sugar-binding domain-containing protein [Saliphagus sp. LR7]
MTPSEISLSGTWELRLDPDGEGAVGWPDAETDGTITLPGTTDEYGYGERPEETPREHLTRTSRYEGPAWYRRTIPVPDSWAGKRVTLTVERSRETTLWVDGERIGSRVCLSTPHVYDVTDALEPGDCEVTIRVDNDGDSMDRRGVRRSHAVAEHTQTNWNGVVGDLRLEATDPVRIEDLRAIPDGDGFALEITTVNDAGDDREGHLRVAAESTNADESHHPDPIERQVELPAGETTHQLRYALGPNALSWDEFSPAVYELRAALDSGEYADEIETTAGLREVAVEGTQLAIGDRTVFLRGRTDCCVFPETGYPPTSTAEWVEHMEVAKAHGLNHYRFHSWCPPEAAFEAADRVGIYLLPECSQWDARGSLVEDDDYDYYRREADRILAAYGNHPSFVAFGLGNENQGDEGRMADLVARCRDRDGRRLYVSGANDFLSAPRPGPQDDLFITANVPEDPDAPKESDLVPVRGTGHVNDRPPSTTTDYREEIAPYDLPVVGHEIGQFQIYPDFDEARKYTGVLEARNLERFERSLADHHMAGDDRRFQAASGALAATCYREEIEAALRTPGFGGFQLLDLADFPGQGTALVGVRDAFMDSKGVIEPHEWRRFCAPQVPLLLMDRYAWTDGETLEAEAKFANYGPAAVEDAAADWAITDGEREVAGGTLPDRTVDQGELAPLGTIEASLSEVDAPAALEIDLEVSGTDRRTSYPIWVYPDRSDDPLADANVAVRHRFDDRARELLAEGRRVLVVPDEGALRYSLRGSFQPDFWNYELFKQNGKPGTLGIACDPEHPLFESFPTAGHADWQWWHLLRHARPIVVDDAPAAFEPTVRAIDTIYRNHKLALFAETAVGDGRLAVCSLDLEPDHPTVDQFRASLAAYLESPAFDPEPAITTGVLENLLGGEDERGAYGDDANGPWIDG